MSQFRSTHDRQRAQSQARSAFTLVELVIVVLVIAILAAIAFPKFSEGSQIANGSALRQDLRYVRTQILVYRAQHDDVSPGYPGGDKSQAPTESAFIDQMTKPTSQEGVVGNSYSSEYRFGPYITEAPVNPVNGSNRVLVLGNSTPFPPMPSDDPGYGWVYKPRTAEVRAYVPGQDQDGQYYYDY